MKICVLGSSSITDKDLVYKTLDRFIIEHSLTSPIFLVGGAKGVDELTKTYAKENNNVVIEFLPYHLLDNRSIFTSKYFFIRNKQMIDNADCVIAFWDLTNKGTEYGIKLAQKKNLPYFIVKRVKKE